MPDHQPCAVLRPLLTFVGKQAYTGLSDSQLLYKFTARRDEEAFVALLRRHAPLVWGVCRRVLRCEADIEDAFQATFFVLARRAGSIRKGESLGSWLHGTAYRVATRARANNAGRPGHPRPAGPLNDPVTMEAAWSELQA